MQDNLWRGKTEFLNLRFPKLKFGSKEPTVFYPLPHYVIHDIHLRVQIFQKVNVNEPPVYIMQIIMQLLHCIKIMQ